MKDLVFSAFLVGFVGFILLFILARIFFKKSILFKIALATGIPMIIGVFLATVVAHFGRIHAFWAEPIAIASVVIGYFYIIKNIKKPLHGIIAQLNELKEGKLTKIIKEDYSDRKDEVGELYESTVNTINKLNDIVEGIIVSSHQIADSSENLSRSSQQISDDVNNQAASVEEVSSTVEEMAANIEQNSNNAVATETIAKQAVVLIKETSDSSKAAVESMNSIAQKINIINDIAFQTNILALNAAVEAARAGEHGKGFAVVAAEVRKLAERSKIAADEINILSAHGLQMVSEAQTKMEKLTPEIERTTVLIQDIAHASVEQRAGSDQINHTIQQLNTITQSNASAADGLSSAAEELASQAESMTAMVGFFKIRKR